jgi:hypothetical protein
MAARVVKRLPEGDDWTYELKFDGYRALIIKDGQRVELRSRKNKDLAGVYPGLAAAGGLCGKSGDGYEHCTNKGTPQPSVRFVTKKDGPIRIAWIEVGVNETPNGIASHELRLGLWTAGHRGEGYAPRIEVAASNRELVRDLD